MSVGSSIPRIIHCCWFGGNAKPELVLRCMASWRRHMPQWRVVEWDERNYDITRSVYVRKAHEAGMWAFASDYARFDILREHGGVYFDTDVELLKPIPDWVLGDDCFTGMEASGLVSPGLVFGCVPGHASLSAILESYDADPSLDTGGPGPVTVNLRVTSVLERQGFRREDVLQRVAGVTIYPSEYFCGYDQDLHEPRVTRSTIAQHHYAHSWGNRRDRRRLRIQRAIRRVVGEPVYRRLLAAKRAVLGVRGA